MKDIVLQSTSTGQRPPIVLEEEESTSLRDYWIVIYRHRRAAIAFLLAAIFVSAISIRWEKPLYTAKSTLYVPNQNRGVLDGAEAIVPATANNDQQRLLRSRTLVADVIKTLELGQDENFTYSPISVLGWVNALLRQCLRGAVDWAEQTRLGVTILEVLGRGPEEPAEPVPFEFGVHPALIDGYFEKLKVTASGDSQLVDVEFTSPNPLLSKEVANTHVASFIKSTLETRFELTADVREFLEKKLTELRLNVERSERALTNFQKDHHIISIDKGGNLLLDQLKKLNSDLTEAQSKRIELESLHRLVQKRDNHLLSQVIDNPTIQALRKQITALEVQDAHLGTKFKPEYRGRIAVLQELNEARSRLDQEINRVVSTIEKDYGAIRAREQALAVETEKARRVALDLQEKAVEHTILEREVNSNRALYEAVFKKTKESTLTGEGPIPSLRVIDRAEIPLQPAGSTWMRSLGLSVVVGLFGGIGLAFLLNLLDSTLKTPEEVMRLLGLPMLGLVPDVKKLAANNSYGSAYTRKISPPPVALAAQQRGSNEQLMVSHHPLSLMGEMYRSICTAIMFSKAESPPRTILISSSQPNEGKTVTAINIAIMLAQSAGPVLLIDGDLHGGRCHTLLGLENGNGLSNILAGGEDPTRTIKKTKIKNLSFLSRGTLPPNPAALLGSDQMRRTLDYVAADFRFIVLDSAPLLPVSDSVLLSTIIDGVILVARAHEVPGDVVRRARDRLNFVDAKILGVVLNGIDITSAEYAQFRQVYRSYYANYAQLIEEPSSNGSSTSGQANGKVADQVNGKVIPPLFVKSINVTLTEYIGPIASVIVSEKIAALGESPEDFPQSRIEELIDSVAHEILDTESRISFKERCSDL